MDLFATGHAIVDLLIMQKSPWPLCEIHLPCSFPLPLWHAILAKQVVSFNTQGRDGAYSLIIAAIEQVGTVPHIRHRAYGVISDSTHVDNHTCRRYSTATPTIRLQRPRPEMTAKEATKRLQLRTQPPMPQLRKQPMPETRRQRCGPHC